LSVQRPFYPEIDGTCHTYILHPPGGIVGGDELAISLHLDPHTRVLVTTPGASRWYYSDARRAEVSQIAVVGNGALLEWLPQETLLFDGADAKLSTRIELSGNAQFLGWEVLGFGRPACQELFTSGRLDFRFELWRDGVLILRERLCGDGLPAGLMGYASLMTFVATGADDLALQAARNVCGNCADVLCAPTLIGDVLICRGLAEECAPLKKLSCQLWYELRPILSKRDAVVPRIWRT
jgi:urease accessory protein